jgi:aspartate--ammonia ligase
LTSFPPNCKIGTSAVLSKQIKGAYIMEELIIPQGYHSPLTIRETEVAIKELKDHFERSLAKALHLTRVSAPLFVRPESGLNDNLNGVERPVSFGNGTR